MPKGRDELLEHFVFPCLVPKVSSKKLLESTRTSRVCLFMRPATDKLNRIFQIYYYEHARLLIVLVIFG